MVIENVNLGIYYSTDKNSTVTVVNHSDGGIVNHGAHVIGSVPDMNLLDWAYLIIPLYKQRYITKQRHINHVTPYRIRRAKHLTLADSCWHW